MQVKINDWTNDYFVVTRDCVIAGVKYFSGTFVYVNATGTLVMIKKASGTIPMHFKLEEVKDLKIRELYKNEPNKFLIQPYR